MCQVMTLTGIHATPRSCTIQVQVLSGYYNYFHICISYINIDLVTTGVAVSGTWNDVLSEYIFHVKALGLRILDFVSEEDVGCA
jgi:hypothetical protein